MKNFILKAFLFITLGITGITTDLSAQDFSEKVRAIKYEFVKTGWTIEAEKTYKLKEGKTESGIFNFKANKCYMVAVISEKEVREVDFSIYEGNGYFLGQIEEEGNLATFYMTDIYPSNVKYLLKNIFSRKEHRAYKTRIIVASIAIDLYGEYSDNYSWGSKF